MTKKELLSLDKVRRRDLINYLVTTYNFSRYLEIGVRDPKSTFNNIDIQYKDGVDPEPLGPEINYPTTSDEFFNNIKDRYDMMYDVVFVDGLHLAHQSYRDVNNSLVHLNPNGIIVMHDCNPPYESRQRENQFVTVDEKLIKYITGPVKIGDRVPLPWNGTVWKAWAMLRCQRSDLEMYVVDTDEGLGVIRRGKQKCFPHWEKDNKKFNDIFQYSYLKEHRKELLNLITVKEFTEIFN